MALTEYEKYIRTEGLLALQKSPDELSCHDEMQFQIVHQVAELWMKLVEFEVRHMADLLGQDQIALATSTLRRIGRIQRLVAQQLDLLDTMSPKAYMTVRAGLGRGSGQESPGFKTLLRLPGEVMWPAFEAVLDRRALSLRQIYEEPEEQHEMFALAEGLVDYDQLLQAWRHRHLMLVYRIIGVGTPSLKGKPSDLLAHGMKQRFFPRLWAVRDELFADWTERMLAGGSDTGYHG
ncbi:MAG TPA: tryptophan 2,3-dioxygenase family protein [Kofleriaceae bacterium]|nr:tryptophan 2,3-dioxygenase family protein [Kofleriaceae bacterium]